MRKKGNGTPEVCVANLLLTQKGEVPYERLKGLDDEIIDSPMSDANAITEETLWLIETYEPRVDADSLRVLQTIDEESIITPEIIVRNTI